MTDDQLKAHELWVQTPHVFILDQTISDAAFRLGCLLAKYAGQNGCAFPKQETLAKDLGWSLRSVSRRVTELRDSGWLRTERRRPGGPCNYYLASAEEARGYDRSGVGVTPNVAQHEIEPVKHLPSGGPHAARAASRRPSKRAEAERLAAEEAAYNPATSMGLWDDEGSDGPQDAVADDHATGGATLGSGRVQRGTQRRQAGPDTGPGLAKHWRDVVNAQPWAFGLESNLKALAGHFVKLKQAGFTPDELRAMSELYATTEGLRNPRALAWSDFIAKRALLADAVRKSREAQAMKQRPDEVYDGWDEPAQQAAADEWTW